MVKTTSGFMYREALLTAATGDCDASTGSSGNGSGAFDYLLLGMLMLIGVVRYRRSSISA
jgi:MYXO-CTERM domain-containing protein